MSKPASAPAPTAASTIFVRLPAYRDPECLPTIERLFERADHPERVVVGLCWQYGPDEGPIEIPAALTERVRVIEVTAAESQGASWAKAQAESLYRDEDFVLFIDAHTQPAIGWDDALLHEWATCDDARAVLSAPPPGYRPPDLLRTGTRPGFRRPARFDEDGLPVFRSAAFDGFPQAPVRVAFAVSRFVFAPGAMIREIPADPALYQTEEDPTLSARLFTHGWRLYAPTDVFIWHLYQDRDQTRPLHWQEHDDWRPRRKAARKRARRLLGIEPLRAHELPDDDTRYGLGSVLSLSDFAVFSGLDLPRSQPTANAHNCPLIVGLRAEADIEGYWLEPPEPEPEAAPPPALRVGDLAPYVRLTTTSGRTAELQLYAGSAVALFFVPARAPATRPFFQMISSRARELDAVGVRPIVIGVGDPAVLRRHQLKAPLTTPLWIDTDGSVACIFGTGEHGERAFLLDRNLRVVRIATGAGPGAIGSIITGAAALLDNSPPRTIEAHPPVLVVPNVIDADLRAELLALWRDSDKFKGRTGSGAGSKVRLSAKVRDDIQVPSAVRARIDEVLVGRLLPEVQKVFGFWPTHREGYKIGCYPADSGGFFSQHRDNFEPALAHRRVALTLNLTEDFEGGRLVFPEYGNDGYRPPAGTAVIFPCALMHRVDPVTAGERFTLVSFFYGDADDRFRRQLRPLTGLPMPTDDRRFKAPRRGAITDREDVRHRYPAPKSEAPLRPITLVESRGPIVPETPRLRAETPPGLLVIDNYLHPDACRRITEYALEAPGRPLKVMDHRASTTDRVKTVASDKRVTEKVKIDGIAPEMLTLFTDIYGHRLEPHYGVEFEWFERPQILRYPPGGLYEPHADAEHWDRQTRRFVRAQDRDYSVLVYVNDGFEGGTIAFPKLDFEVKPQPGMLVAFPSDHRFEHAARPTTSGTRIAVVSWAAVRGTPRVRKKAPFGAVILRPR